MQITDKEIKKAIKILKSGRPNSSWESIYYILHPLDNFRFRIEKDLCDIAQDVNGKKDIFDKRTKGWKVIRDKYNKHFLV